MQSDHDTRASPGYRRRCSTSAAWVWTPPCGRRGAVADTAESFLLGPISVRMLVHVSHFFDSLVWPVDASSWETCGVSFLQLCILFV